MICDVEPHGPGKRSRNLTDQLEGTLTERIRQGLYPPGARLPSESEIAVECGVSRTVVREAISRLQAAGLATKRHGIGTFVLEMMPPIGFDIDAATQVTLDDVLSMMELRISLEVEAAALAAARRADAHVAELKKILERFEMNRAESSDTIGPDYEFHLKIAQATGNHYFADIMTRLGTATIPRNRLAAPSSDDPNLLRTVERQHREIFEAIRARDPETARMTMRLHLTASRERLRRARDTAALLSPHSSGDRGKNEPVAKAGPTSRV
jgi:GntR family transcriptional regulator, transcriptional repressor for pyruvate dehydrogenase complex